jgi:hypothetical protein
VPPIQTNVAFPASSIAARGCGGRSPRTSPSVLTSQAPPAGRYAAWTTRLPVMPLVQAHVTAASPPASTATLGSPCPIPSAGERNARGAHTCAPTFPTDTATRADSTQAATASPAAFTCRAGPKNPASALGAESGEAALQAPVARGRQAA